MESVLRLRDEEDEEEEEEEGNSRMVARARAGTDIGKASGSVGTDSVFLRSDKAEENTSTQVPEQRGTEDVIPVEEAIDNDAGTELEVYHGEGVHGEEDPFHGYFVGIEDATGPSDSEPLKKSSGKAGIPHIFDEAQQALNRASALCHEAFFRSQGELSQSEAKIRRFTEERDTFKLLSEQKEGEAKGLRVELEAGRKEQTDLSEQVKRIFEVTDTDLGVTANSSVSQVQQKLDVIGQLHAEVDAVKAGAEKWKKNMDRLAAEKETARDQLALVEEQLRSSKERALVQDKNIEEFQSRLDSMTSDREKLASEQATVKSGAEIAMDNADAIMAVYRSDAEAAQVRQRTKIENAKELEAEARMLAFPDDYDTGSMSGSESGDLESEDAAPGED
ncbi:uncharacterized protein [Nicotiana tomentosiformis]|uniref:uncharacterized protein n=1 Tax=Nicotiana tomentosiformis TaxID=4098 RepID=UPI00388C7D3B